MSRKRAAKVQFEGELIEGHKGVTAVIVPFDPREVWGREPIALDDRRKGWLVRGKANGARFDGWIGFRWGRYFIILDAALRAAAGAAVGDPVEMAVEPTDAPAALDVAHEQAKLTTAPRRERGAETPAGTLGRFIDKFEPAVAARARGALAAMRRRLPGALELVYDNYNALGVGFSPTERASDVIFSIVLYPRWVTLFFLQDGVRLPDPERRLAGSGKRVRHIVLERGARTLAEPAVAALMDQALRRARVAIDPNGRRRILIKSVAAKQRPRRPD